MKQNVLLRSLFTVAFISAICTGCGGGGSTPPPPVSENPIPTISAVSPGSATPGAAGITVTVTGSRFVTGAVVQWNGSARSTTFADSGQIKAELSAADFASAGTAAITVVNPGPGGGTSNPVTFAVEPDSGTQWQMTELALNAQGTYANPFVDNSISAQFDGPAGERLTIPGFYDGNGVYRVRFTPTSAGTWRYQVAATNAADKGLHGIGGSLAVAPASSTNPLYQHGGFLRVSENHRYLTYTDGTPFFWLGDFWSFAPSSLLPIDGDKPAFKLLVDKRNAQHYSVLQWGFLDAGSGHEWCCGANSTKVLASQQRFDPAYWQLLDRYFSYAQDHGLLPVFGFGWTRYDPAQLTLDQWKFLWSYVMARYAATPVTFMVTMEYNAGNDPVTVTTALALGQHIKDSDPYKRAMTINAWAIWVEGRQAWTEPWYDFIMYQGGHWSPPLLADSSFFKSAYNSVPTRPMLDSESCYEGILGYGGSPNQVVGPEQSRRAAYYSIQLGGFGYSYGAHGLWYPTQSYTDDRYWSDWGHSEPWWTAMEFPAGQQMQYLRALYESVEWWKLEPRYDAVARFDGAAVEDWYHPRAKATADDLYLVWFPYGLDPGAQFTLRLQAADARTFSAKWFDPQTGSATELADTFPCAASICTLPSRPNAEDWVLVLTRIP